MDDQLKEYLIPIIFVIAIMIFFYFFSNIITQFVPELLQFFVIGIPLFFVIFYYFEKGTKKSPKGHLLGLFLSSLGWDLVSPAFSVFPSGAVSSSTALFLNGTSVDYFIGTALHFLGITGATLFFATYVVFFVILYVGGKQIAEKI